MLGSQASADAAPAGGPGQAAGGPRQPPPDERRFPEPGGGWAHCGGLGLGGRGRRPHDYRGQGTEELGAPCLDAGCGGAPRGGGRLGLPWALAPAGPCQGGGDGAHHHAGQADSGADAWAREWGHPRARWRGPLAAVQAAIRRVRWVASGPLDWADAGGEQIPVDDQAALKEMIHADFRRR